MLDSSIEVLEKIEQHGYVAYIVGGFVRDFVLGNISKDIDICTNAKPMEVIDIFDNVKLPKESYGAVTIKYNSYRFEITTFRNELGYLNNRKPESIKYIDSLEEDLIRRDFTINSLCMDKNKNIIDTLNGRKDLDDRIIRTIIDASQSFKLDALRMLRAIRFATILNFKLSDEIRKAIIENKDLLRNISYYRKKEELDKIFTSSNVSVGVNLIIELGLDEVLEINKLKDIVSFNDLLGIWAVLDTNNYPFTSNEKSIIESIKKCLELDNMDNYTLYKYGLYVNQICADIKGLDRREVSFTYDNLIIKNKNEINITASEIIEITNNKKIVNQVFNDLIKDILYKNIENNRDDLREYILKKYC